MHLPSVRAKMVARALVVAGVDLPHVGWLPVALLLQCDEVGGEFAFVDRDEPYRFVFAGEEVGELHADRSLLISTRTVPWK